MALPPKRVRATLLSITLLPGMVFGSTASFAPLAASVAAAATCPSGGCTVTVDARDFASGDQLDTFTFIVNADNTKLPTNPEALSTESNSPIVKVGDQDSPIVKLPAGRYLISVRSLDHKMWGKHISLPTDDGVARIELTEQSADHPLPLGKIRVFVFQDNAWTNGAPDTEEGGLSGFQIGLEEQTGSAVTVDYNNVPLCGGVCLTDGDGFVQADDLGPATYYIDVHPPDGPCNDDPSSQWYQTTTIDGGLQLQAPVEEGSDGTGAPGEQLWEAPNLRTAYWFGFVCSPQAFATDGTGEITGTARNWQGWPPFDVLTLGEPVQDPFIALSDSTTDLAVYVGRGDSAGNFDIQNVPAGSYNLAVWDEQLTYIFRFKPITIAAGEVVDVNEADPVHAGEVGLGVSRWFGWLDGYVYKDLNANGIRDDGEPGIPNTDVDQRWRDGSIKEGTVTDPQGYYEYPTAEGGALGRWIIGEQGFTRFGVTGAAVHDEYDGTATHVPSGQGGNLLTNQLLSEGHRATVDWGKVNYPPGEPGQIVGITYFATTRNEFNAALQAHEDYEPAIPDVTVLLETVGPDGLPNTDDDVVVNSYVTDHWQQPDSSQDPPQSCAIRDAQGLDISGDLNPIIGPHCLEVPITGQQTKDGAFDGGYAFADYCPGGYDLVAEDGTCIGGSDPVAIVAGDYIVHAIMPKDAADTRDCNPANPDGLKNISDQHGSIPGGGQGCLYRIVREEDVNVDLGNSFTTAIPPPPCVGDDHIVDQATVVMRSPLFGDPAAHAPLCDKHLVTLQNGQNANADFNMMTNFRTDPNGSDDTDTRTGDVAEPGRLVGQVFNDIYFERNPMSVWYGEPRPIGGIPVGIYARVDTVPNTSCPDPFDAENCFTPDHWRLLTTVTTSPDGSFEVLVPSTETFNCPIPQGPCPGMYLVTVDDPGSKAHPNPNFNPNLLVATTPAEAWPGQTTQLDLPLDPISGTACEDPAVPARPELLQVSRPYVLEADVAADRRITIQGDFIGSQGPADATGGRVVLTGQNGETTTLTRANGGVVSWTAGNATTTDKIVIQVPAVSGTFAPGQKQLTIVTANTNGGVSSVNGITLHVLYASTSVGARTDIASTNDGTLVLDPSIVAADNGRTVNALLQTGLSGGRTITSVTPGVNFTINSPATANGTRILTITRSDTGTITSGNKIVLDSSITAADNGRTVLMSGGGGWGFNVLRTIASVTPGVSFTVNGSNATSSGSRTFTIIKTDTGASISNGTLVLDPSITAGDVGKPVSGPGIPAGATIVSVSPATSFVLSAPATASASGVSLTIGAPASVTPYSPAIVNVDAPPPGPGTNPHAIQDAIDAAAPGSLLVLKPGVYNENVLLWKPLKLQGLGPGGVVGAHEFQARDPEDPRFNVKGTVIDGRFFSQNAVDFDASVSDNGPYALADAPLNVVLRGADITVVAKATDAYDIAAGPTGVFGAARVDGVGLTTGRGDGAGGVQLQANVNNMQITNDVLENNGGVSAGGIGIGQLFARGSHNFSARIANDRLTGNGGLTTSGGIGIFYGSDGYDVANNIICSNFSVEYGAGISHIGLSPGGAIHDNQIYYNDAVDSGAGIAIESELAVGGGSLGDGSGAVNIDRNLIQSNYSGDDGGGIFTLDTLDQPINIRNNMIVDNGASDLGGAITIDDGSRISIINNTISDNVSTGSSEGSDGNPHSAGLAAEANEPLWQTDARYLAQYPTAASRPRFANPVALFNNIFWNNNAFTLSGPGPGATLVDQGFVELEVFGTGFFADRLTPRYSLLTNNGVIAGNGAARTIQGGQANIIGADPSFVTPFILELGVTGSRLDPQTAAVTITGADPPVGLTGDYHLNTNSPAIDQGAGFSNLAVPAPLTQTPNSNSILAPCSGTLAQSYAADFDRQFRPQLRANGRVRTPWDLGADELPGTGTPTPRVLAIPGTYTQGPDVTFNWNGAGQLQCSASTVP